MALALTHVKSYGIESSEPLQKRFWQCLELDITGANTDATYDFGVYAGTFWTAVSATDPGKTALKAVQDIQIKARLFIAVGGLTGRTQLGTPATNQLTTVDSTAGSGGASTATLTVTGLAAADVILGVSQLTSGANHTAFVEWTDTSRTANQLAVRWTGDPGAGAVVRVIKRTAASGAVTPSAGQYTIALDATNTNIPDITFASGDAPTAAKLLLIWELNDNEIPDEVTL